MASTLLALSCSVRPGARTAGHRLFTGRELSRGSTSLMYGQYGPNGGIFQVRLILFLQEIRLTSSAGVNRFFPAGACAFAGPWEKLLGGFTVSGYRGICLCPRRAFHGGLVWKGCPMLLLLKRADVSLGPLWSTSEKNRSRPSQG